MLAQGMEKLNKGFDFDKLIPMSRLRDQRSSAYDTAFLLLSV